MNCVLNGLSAERLFRQFLMLLLVLAAAALFGIAAAPVRATEMGGGAYPNGAEDFMSGAVPPPGFYFINYLNYYRADTFRDSSGNGGAVPDFDLKATANVFRFIYVTKQQVLGGFWGVHAFIPVVNLDVSAAGHSQSKTGIGDIIIDPFILSWHAKNWHAVTGLDIYFPTGAYDSHDLANIGRNYWTFEPVAAFTYVSDSGFDVSAKFMYDFNTKNDDTNYTSGQEFHVDYSVAKKFDNLSIGLGGYYYKQMTNDKQSGGKVGDGNKGQAIGIGPQIKYDHKNMSFLLKYQAETSVKNRPDGDKFWLKFVYAF